MTFDGRIPATEDELKNALGEEVIPDEPKEEEVEKEGGDEGESKDKQETPPEVVITLETGEVFKGKDYQEVAQKIARAKEIATHTIRDREQQIRDLRTPKEEEKQETGFDRETYYGLFAEDPIAAQNYLMSTQMGVAPEEVGSALRYAYSTSQVVNAHMENAQFRARFPQAPQGDQFAEQMIARMGEKSREWTADNLGASYLELVNEGRIKPVVEQEATPEPKPTPKPTPSLGKPKASGVPAELSNAEDLTTEELEKLLRKNRLLY